MDYTPTRPEADARPAPTTGRQSIQIAPNLSRSHLRLLGDRWISRVVMERERRGPASPSLVSALPPPAGNPCEPRRIFASVKPGPSSTTGCQTGLPKPLATAGRCLRQQPAETAGARAPAPHGTGSTLHSTPRTRPPSSPWTNARLSRTSTPARTMCSSASQNSTGASKNCSTALSVPGKTCPIRPRLDPLPRLRGGLFLPVQMTRLANGAQQTQPQQDTDPASQRACDGEVV